MSGGKRSGRLSRSTYSTVFTSDAGLIGFRTTSMSRTRRSKTTSNLIRRHVRPAFSSFACGCASERGHFEACSSHAVLQRLTHQIRRPLLLLARRQQAHADHRAAPRDCLLAETRGAAHRSPERLARAPPRARAMVRRTAVASASEHADACQGAAFPHYRCAIPVIRLPPQETDSRMIAGLNALYHAIVILLHRPSVLALAPSLGRRPVDMPVPCSFFRRTNEETMLSVSTEKCLSSSKHIVRGLEGISRARSLTTNARRSGWSGCSASGTVSASLRRSSSSASLVRGQRLE